MSVADADGNVAVYKRGSDMRQHLDVCYMGNAVKSNMAQASREQAVGEEAVQ